jgi:hypothetical protein
MKKTFEKHYPEFLSYSDEIYIFSVRSDDDYSLKKDIYLTTYYFLIADNHRFDFIYFNEPNDILNFPELKKECLKYLLLK